MAMPAQAADDFSAALASVTDLGGGHYSFSQGGWLGGGLLTGTFAGIDLDNDRQLVWFNAEISAFSVAFSGNSIVRPFRLGFDNLYGLVYDLDGGPMGDGISGYYAEGIFALDINKTYIDGPGLMKVCGAGEMCATVANVPEPANWALLIAGFGLTGAVMRRRRYLAV